MIQTKVPQRPYLHVVAYLNSLSRQCAELAAAALAPFKFHFRTGESCCCRYRAVGLLGRNENFKSNLHVLCLSTTL